MKLHFKQTVLDRVDFSVDREFDMDLYKNRFDGLEVTDLENATVDIGFQAVHMEGAELTGLELSDEASPFDIELSIKLAPKEPKRFPYRVEIVISGLFIVQDKEAKTIGERKAFALVEGCATLMGSIRELLISLTSRSYFGPVLLPALPIRTMVRQQIEDRSKGQARKPKPKPDASAAT